MKKGLLVLPLLALALIACDNSGGTEPSNDSSSNTPNTSLNSETPNSSTSTDGGTTSETPEVTMNVNIDFKTNFSTYASEWDNRYETTRELSGSDLGTNEDIKVSLNAAKQSSTITDMPVIASKNAESYVTVSSTTKNINAIEFGFTQWKNEYVERVFKSMYFEYSTDGEKWTEVSGAGFKDDTTGKFVESLAAKNIENAKSVRLVIFGTEENSNCQLGLSTLALNLN